MSLQKLGQILTVEPHADLGKWPRTGHSTEKLKAVLVNGYFPSTLEEICSVSVRRPVRFGCLTHKAPQNAQTLHPGFCCPLSIHSLLIFILPSVCCPCSRASVEPDIGRDQTVTIQNQQEEVVSSQVPSSILPDP